MADPKVFLPGQSEAPEIPLARFLPPLPTGVIATWLAANLQPGAWILDPFGASPTLAIEAAQAGYRVAVAANNPIARFLLETLAQPPTGEQLRGALAELAASRRADERLEPHIQGLYQTACPVCNTQGPAEAFIWERDAQAPYAKLVDCPHCGERGEHPANDEDRERAAEFQRGGPHRARALERIAPSGSANRRHAEEALETYLPRAVYALFTLLNRLDGLEAPPAQQRWLEALMLSACDRGNSLWAHPAGRARPKQLGPPPVFREHNIWRELEAAQARWSGDGAGAALSGWPDAPPQSGGISLYEGRLKDMVANTGQVRFDAVVTAFPRPNQAYWTLSALWAGWLWGRDAIGPFAAVLRRRRYDWSWHTEALHSSLERLAAHLPEGTTMFGVVGESEPGLNAAVLLAANLAGFQLEGLSMRRERAHTQFTWRSGATKGKAEEPSRLVEAAAKHVLRQRGEPSHFDLLHAAAFSELARSIEFSREEMKPGELFTRLRDQLGEGLSYRRGFLRYGGTEHTLETGHWWLENVKESRSPLADRIEIALVRYLLRYPGRSIEEIDQALCKVFPGLLTPPRRLIEIALTSYGAQQDGGWSLDPVDQPRARREDLRAIRRLIEELGTRMDFQVAGYAPIKWTGKDGKTRHNFHVLASAVLGDLLAKPVKAGESHLIVLPGGRSHLALYKIERDPRLRHNMENGWRFLKFRHLRRLAENQALTIESFEDLLDLDPLAEEQIQPPLL